MGYPNILIQYRKVKIMIDSDFLWIQPETKDVLEFFSWHFYIISYYFIYILDALQALKLMIYNFSYFQIFFKIISFEKKREWTLSLFTN